MDFANSPSLKIASEDDVKRYQETANERYPDLEPASALAAYVNKERIQGVFFVNNEKRYIWGPGMLFPRYMLTPPLGNGTDCL